MKKNKEVKRRHKFIIGIARLLTMPFLMFKYKYKTKYYKELKDTGPYIILANHVVSVDVMMLGLSFPFNLYYFATEHLFNLGFLSKLLVFAANPIKKSKSKADLDSIRKARRIAQEGGSIAVFPEGNLTYTGETNHFAKSVVKLIKLLKLPVITFKFEGLFLSNPRWGVESRKGSSHGYIEEIIEYEEYRYLSDEELYQMVYKGIYTNAYEDNIDVLYKGSNIAHGLERLVFMDLQTNTPFNTYTKNNLLLSKDSNYQLKYKENGYVEDISGHKQTLIDLNLDIIKSYYNYYYSDKEFSYKNKGLVEKNKGNKRIKVGDLNVELTKTSIIIWDREQIHYDFKFENIDEVAMQGKNKLIIYDKNDTYLITFDHKVSTYAFLITFQFYKRKGELDESIPDFSSFGL